MPPVLSSQQYNGLMASMYGERNEVKRFRSHLTCTCDINASAWSEYFWLIDLFLGLFILWCVRLCAPGVDSNTVTLACESLRFRARCRVGEQLPSPLSSGLLTPTLTALIPHLCTQPVVATVDQHICSPTLTQSGRRQGCPASAHNRLLIHLDEV